jgi:O-antigen/teichoic acid export membrane protein
MSFKKSAAISIKWSTLSQIGRQGMQLATLIILANLLTPADFGLVGMATIVTGFAAIFKDLGTSAAVIQRPEIPDDLLQSIFWLNVVFGLCLTFLLLGISPFIANLYHEPRVAKILSVLAPTFLIAGFSILHQSLLERKLEFNKLAKIEMVATLLAAIVGMSSALLGAGVWSLVYQTITLISTTTLQLWIATPWQPKLVFDWREVKSVTGFSLNLTGFSIFNYFARNADYFLIGRFLGAQSLGYYTLAYRLMFYPLQNIASVIGRVVFPIFSQMQHDHARFSYAYLRVTRTIALVSFPLMMGIWILAEPFVMAVFGSKWQPIIILLLILSPIGIIQSIGTTVGAIYQAKGRTDWMLWWGLSAGTLVVLSFGIGLRWGLVGVASAYAIVSSLLIYPSFAIPFRLIDLSMREFLAGLGRPFLCSSLMLLVLAVVRMVLPGGLASYWQLVILIPLGGLVYLLTSWLINREQIQETMSMIGIGIRE